MINKILKKLLKKRLPEILRELMDEGKIKLYFPKSLIEDVDIYINVSND